MRAGYEFLGWRYEGGLVATSTNLPKVMPAEDQNYKAEWKLLSYDIHYVNDVDENLPQSYTVEDLPITLPEQVKEGWTFLGFTAEGGIEVTKPVKELVIPAGTTGDITVTANWTINKHDLTLNANGGLFVTGKEKFVDEDVPFDTPFTNWPVPVKDGYELKGWELADGSEVPETMPDADLEAFAVWEVKQIKVTVDYGDGGQTPNTSRQRRDHHHRTLGRQHA